MDPTHSIRITCTLLGTPIFPAYINLMFLVFIARLYWLVSSISQAFIQSSRIPHSCRSLFVCLFISLVSPSTLSFGVFLISDPTFDLPLENDYDSSSTILYFSPVSPGLDPCLPHGHDLGLPSTSLSAGVRPLDCHSFPLVYNKPTFSSWTWSGDWFLLYTPWHQSVSGSSIVNKQP